MGFKFVTLFFCANSVCAATRTRFSQQRMLSAVLCWALLPACAHAEIISLQLLDLFYAQDPRALGLGLPGSLDIDAGIDNPLALARDASIIALEQGYENVADNRNKHLAARHSTATGIFNFNLPWVGASTVGVQVSAFDADNWMRDIERYALEQQRDAQSVSFAVRPDHFLAVGVGLERVGSDTRFFYAVETEIPYGVRLKYRDYRKHAAQTASLTLDTHEGIVNIVDEVQVHELSVASEINHMLSLSLSAELNREHNGAAEIIALPSATSKLIYRYSAQQFNFADGLKIDGDLKGRARADLTSLRHALLLRVAHQEGIDLFYGAQWSKHHIAVDGKVYGEPLLSFWPDLTVGERRFDAGYALESVQVALGAEYQRTPALTLRGGVQYLHLDTRGEFKHWMPIPFLGFGTLDEHTIFLPLDYAIFGGLAFGVSYRVGALEWSYAICQLLLIKKHDVVAESNGSTATAQPLTALTQRASLAQAQDGAQLEFNSKLIPEGSLQLLQMTWHL